MNLMHLPGSGDRDVLLGHEVDDLLLRLRGLVLVRDLLAERDGPPVVCFRALRIIAGRSCYPFEVPGQ